MAEPTQLPNPIDPPPPDPTLEEPTPTPMELATLAAQLIGANPDLLPKSATAAALDLWYAACNQIEYHINPHPEQLPNPRPPAPTLP